MQEGRYLGRLEPGMDVCDVNGNKFGAVGRVYRNASVGVGAGAAEATPPDEVLEIKTGPFGLGKHLYIPFSAIQDVTSGCVFVNEPKERVSDMGWDTKPEYLDQLT